MKSVWGTLLKVIAGIFGVMVGVYPLLRRIYSTWGTVDNEAQWMLPGDELVPRPRVSATRAIIIDAPHEQVFPWLLQMGKARGGLYSYQKLENFFGLHMSNASELLPEYQRLKVGEALTQGFGMMPPFKVEQIQPDQALILKFAPEKGKTTPVGSWVFYLRPITSRQTRLIVRTRLEYSPNPINFVFWRLIVEPAHFIMEERMLRGIKERAELASQPTYRLAQAEA
jgi:hypothetical protein